MNNINFRTRHLKSCKYVSKFHNPIQRSPAGNSDGEVPGCMVSLHLCRLIPMHTGLYFADGIFKFIPANRNWRLIIQIPLKFVSMGSIGNKVSLVKSNGIAPRRHQAITRSNDDPIHWRTNASSEILPVYVLRDNLVDAVSADVLASNDARQPTDSVSVELHIRVRSLFLLLSISWIKYFHIKLQQVIRCRKQVIITLPVDVWLLAWNSYLKSFPHREQKFLLCRTNKLTADCLVMYQGIEATTYLKRVALIIVNLFHFMETKSSFSKFPFCNDAMILGGRPIHWSLIQFYTIGHWKGVQNKSKYDQAYQNVMCKRLQSVYWINWICFFKKLCFWADWYEWNYFQKTPALAMQICRWIPQFI